MTDGYRASSESWAALLRDCARRGMRAPVHAVGDGALGFWKALREIFPDTREQRCWVHQTANVLDAMPKLAKPAEKKAIQDICNAEHREDAQQAVKTFAKLYGAKFPKAVAKITDCQDVLLEFFDYPPSTGCTFGRPTPSSRPSPPSGCARRSPRAPPHASPGLAMVFKLVESAQARWRAVNGSHLVPLVRAGVRFERGLLVHTCPDTPTINDPQLLTIAPPVS